MKTRTGPSTGPSTTDKTKKRRSRHFGNEDSKAYSMVHHLDGNLQTIGFSAGLREEKTEGVLEKLLPMLRIQPRDQVAKKNKRGSMAETCLHPDCVERESRIIQLQEVLVKEKEQIAVMINDIQLVNDRHEQAIKDIERIESQVDVAISERIEQETQNQAIGMAVDAAEGRSRAIREQLEAIKGEVEELAKRAKEREREKREQQAFRDSLKCSEMVFKKAVPGVATREELLVRTLPMF